MGPTLFFGGLPDKTWVIFVGLVLEGFCVMYTYVLVTPEILNALND